jgi:hypothetical protein
MSVPAYTRSVPIILEASARCLPLSCAQVADAATRAPGYRPGRVEGVGPGPAWPLQRPAVFARTAQVPSPCPVPFVDESVQASDGDRA